MSDMYGERNMLLLLYDLYNTVSTLLIIINFQGHIFFTRRSTITFVNQTYSVIWQIIFQLKTRHPLKYASFMPIMSQTHPRVLPLLHKQQCTESPSATTDSMIGQTRRHLQHPMATRHCLKFK